MSNEFYAPYNFVPTTGKVNNKATPTVSWGKAKEDYIPKGAPQARHDKWVKDTKSGRIVCKVTTQTSTVVGANQTSGGNNTPGEVSPYMVEGIAALPGNSLRGMIGSISEQLSQSALRVLGDQLLTVRKPADAKHACANIGILIPKGEEKIIVPLTIGPIPWNQNHTFKLAEEQQEVFSGLKWKEILPVYLDGYKKSSDGKLIKYGFLSQDRHNTTTFEKNKAVYYWAKVLGPDKEYDDEIDPDDTRLKIKTIKDKNGNIKSKFLLGQRLDSRYPVPLSEEEYKKLSNEEKKGFLKGVLFILGLDGRESEMPANKKHEYFIPLPENGRKAKHLIVKQNVIDNFKILAQEAVDRSNKSSSDVSTPFFPKGYEDHKLRMGNLVRYAANFHTQQVTEISWSSIWRKLVDGNQRSFFSAISPNLLPWDRSRTELTPAELLFGVVEDFEKDESNYENGARNIASRVRFSDGLSQHPVHFEPAVTLKILSSPKLPSPSMYFQASNGRPIKKTDLSLAAGHQPRGRKVFVHHHQTPKNSDPIWKTQKQSDHLQQKLRVTPIPKETEFWFHIDFDNLTNEELSLLIKSIVPSSEFQHRLGLGKPLGLGSVKVDIAGTFLIDRMARYQDMLNLSDNEPRYHSFIKGSITTDSFPEQYSIEQTALNKQPEESWQPSGKLIDQQTLDILNTVGDPSKMKQGVEVTYPMSVRQLAETEGFEWFVNNEEHQTQALPIIQANQILSTLSKNEPKSKANKR